MFNQYWPAGLFPSHPIGLLGTHCLPEIMLLIFSKYNYKYEHRCFLIILRGKPVFFSLQPWRAVLLKDPCCCWTVGQIFINRKIFILGEFATVSFFVHLVIESWCPPRSGSAFLFSRGWCLKGILKNHPFILSNINILRVVVMIIPIIINLNETLKQGCQHRKQLSKGLPASRGHVTGDSFW